MKKTRLCCIIALVELLAALKDARLRFQELEREGRVTKGHTAPFSLAAISTFLGDFEGSFLTISLRYQQ